MHTGKHKNEEAVLRGGFFKHHGGVFRMHYDDDALQSSHACSAALHKEWEWGGGVPPAPHASLALFCFTDNGAVGLTVFTRARPIDALFWE